MEWIIDNWFIIAGAGAIIAALAFAIYKYAGLPTATQVAKIKEWLLFAVTTAEAELGSGTGQLKLRYVYDMFISRFPLAAKVVSFELFSAWVDEALDQMVILLQSTKELAALVYPELIK